MGRRCSPALSTGSDILDTPDGGYFRVIDYKTGHKDFDYTDLLCGQGLQIASVSLCHRALEGQPRARRTTPAGVLYVPGRVDVERERGAGEADGFQKAAEKIWCGRGFCCGRGRFCRRWSRETRRSICRMSRTKRAEPREPCDKGAVRASGTLCRKPAGADAGRSFPARSRPTRLCAVRRYQAASTAIIRAPVTRTPVSRTCGI